MLGPLAALAGGGQVCDLNSGGVRGSRGAGKIFSGRLVLLVKTCGAGVKFYTVEKEEKKDYDTMCDE